MNLFLFPHEISKYNGYGIVVGEDYDRLHISENDTVVWYSYDTTNDLKGNHFFIDRKRVSIAHRLVNVLQNRPGTEISKKMLAELPLTDDYTTIFCGDTIFYRALREKYPEKHLQVRFHNCFYRINERRNNLSIPVDFKFSLQLKIFSKLEKEIFSDPLITPIFLSKEDQSFFEQETGRKNSVLWGVRVNSCEREKRIYGPITRLVYFGGIESHKKKSLDFFVSKIWPSIRKSLPHLSLHLFGYGSHAYHKKKNNINGHGFYESDEWPFSKSALYINPDIIGGGVKIKVKTYLENNLRFITTPFGFEGYDPKLVDGKTVFCQPLDLWQKEIARIVNESQKG